MTQTAPPAPASLAGDVVAVGHEIGRITTDGTIIGRAEPFAKVFASSRQVKRTVGVMAWAILEDIALDAHLDHVGRLVAATNVRRIADNLGVSKNTVATHLTRLRDAGFVLHEEGDHDHTGRYTVSRYVLDPSACVERFTHTPARHQRTVADDPEPTATSSDDDATRTRQGVPADIAAHDNPTATNPHGPVVAGSADDAEMLDRPESLTEDVFGPCTSSWDTAPGTVSQSVGHRELGHNNKEEVVVLKEQHRAREGPTPVNVATAIDRLIRAGVTPTRARHLGAQHPPETITDAIDAAGAAATDNPPGWIVTALEGGWDITEAATRTRRQRQQRAAAAQHDATRRHADQAAQRHATRQRDYSQGWADVAATILDDHQLRQLIQSHHDPRFPASTSSTRMTRALITGWVAAACHHRQDLDPSTAILQALTDPTDLPPPANLPPPPTVDPPALTLDRRITTAQHTAEPPGHSPTETDTSRDHAA